jgi:hypothetical protein
MALKTLACFLCPWRKEKGWPDTSFIFSFGKKQTRSYTIIVPTKCIAPPEDDPRGLKHVGAKNTKAKVQIVIFCAFNNKN